jgi:hypothetical protein
MFERIQFIAELFFDFFRHALGIITLAKKTGTLAPASLLSAPIQIAVSNLISHKELSLIIPTAEDRNYRSTGELLPVCVNRAGRLD